MYFVSQTGFRKVRAVGGRDVCLKNGDWRGGEDGWMDGMSEYLGLIDVYSYTPYGVLEITYYILH